MIFWKILRFLHHRLKKGGKRCNIKTEDGVEMEGKIMTALRQEALSMLEQCPEEKLAVLVDLMRPMCTPAESELPDDGTDPLVFYRDY